MSAEERGLPSIASAAMRKDDQRARSRPCRGIACRRLTALCVGGRYCEHVLSLWLKILASIFSSRRVPDLARKQTVPHCIQRSIAERKLLYTIGNVRAILHHQPHARRAFLVALCFSPCDDDEFAGVFLAIGCLFIIGVNLLQLKATPDEQVLGLEPI